MPNPLYDALFAPLEGRTSDLLILPDGSRLSGDAFLRLVARQAHALRAAGVEPGDRIAVQVGKSPEALAVYGASVALGAVFLPLNTAYTAGEIDYFLGNATPRIFLCDGTKAEALAPVAAAHGARLMVLNADGSGEMSDLAEGQPEAITAADRAPEDLAALLYTSGTTGRSKGAMLSHANLLSNAAVLADLWRFTEADVLLHALPIFHTHGLFVACNTLLLTGGAMIFLPGFDLGAVLRLLPQATTMMGVPTFYTRLLDDPRFARELTQGMRLFISGSAPLLAETHLAFEERTGHRILERYGMTETNMNTSNPYDGERRAGTVGFPLPGVELRIMAEGAEVAPGEVGVIEVRGPNVFGGYWQMPEKTAEELRPDGWFITGDLGMRDAEGYVQIVGRQKDLVISGGFNVYPKEVELLLDEAPGVLESAVVGLPHPDFGEAVFAVLVPRPGVTLDAEAVLASIADRLARYKQPKAAVVLAELPRNTMGKVQKAQLRADHAGWFSR
ncbi:malonyl-CoA synthase [Cereibacter changlensis JA139]|uniref:Malonyl-CoA synthase n=2 Tax=Cereibacter changlensis TaxID=402884 RepID=A0A2T4K0B9_9RHOB|nr:malonyl-CoA synthase [Cereibacter changlensis]PTE23527.1 malonyl-CoA synthase [Cereibacter changlensis JA139]PZX58559.1 malonyl-CoA/methylmalonyl-CoA synthetase [Cereibacter changlensis]